MILLGAASGEGTLLFTRRTWEMQEAVSVGGHVNTLLGKEKAIKIHEEVTYYSFSMRATWFCFPLFFLFFLGGPNIDHFCWKCSF